MTPQVIEVRKRARLHTVDIQTTLQVIDLVLQYPREPAGGLEALRPGVFVEVFDGYPA